MSKEEAIATLGFFIGRVGGGYHPDTPMSEYIDSNYQPTFTPGVASFMQKKHDEVVAALNDDVYTIGLQLMEEML